MLNPKVRNHVHNSHHSYISSTSKIQTKSCLSHFSTSVLILSFNLRLGDCIATVIIIITIIIINF
jgi:hypothetical protein